MSVRGVVSKCSQRNVTERTEVNFDMFYWHREIFRGFYIAFCVFILYSILFIGNILWLVKWRLQEVYLSYLRFRFAVTSLIFVKIFCIAFPRLIPDARIWPLVDHIEIVTIWRAKRCQAWKVAIRLAHFDHCRSPKWCVWTSRKGKPLQPKDQDNAFPRCSIASQGGYGNRGA